MTTGTYDKTDQPLTREDVERLLQQAGSPDKLNLSGMNLRGIDLSGFNLAGANLTGANFTVANLTEANLTGANLTGANLTQTFLADANLSHTILRGATMIDPVLTKEIVYTQTPDGYSATMKLGKGVVSFKAGSLDELKFRINQELLRYKGAIGVDEINTIRFPSGFRNTNHLLALMNQTINFHRFSEKMNFPDLTELTIPFRITEEPLTSYNLALALTALTELYTKYWLIAKGRYADLIEYTQTHDARFAKEAGATIAYARYNSPFNFGIQVDKLVPSVADATMTVVNGLTQRKANLEKLELENQAAAQKIKEDEQNAEQGQQMSAIELEKQRLAIEEDRLALVEHRLDIQKKGFEDALELASKTVDILRPNADPDARAMMIQSVLPSILQLQNVTGLELALPPPKKEE